MFLTFDSATNDKLKSDNSKRYSRSSTSVSQKVEKKATNSYECSCEVCSKIQCIDFS